MTAVDLNDVVVDRFKRYCWLRNLLRSHSLSREMRDLAILEFESFTSEEVTEFERRRSSYHSRKSRLKNKLEPIMFLKDIFFITLTFSDKFVNLKYETYVKRISKIFRNEIHVGNVDYGSKNNRIHFHLVSTLSSLDVDNLKRLWIYGFVDVKHITVRDHGAISGYLFKLTNHGVKVKKHRRMLTNKKTKEYLNSFIKVVDKIEDYMI